MKRISRSSGVVWRVRPPRALGPVLLTIVLLFIIVVVLLWRSTFASLVWRATQPLMRWRSDASASEVEQLQAQLASTTAALADRDLLYQENVDLKARLGRDAAQQTILAGVLLRPPQTPYDTLMIDAGSVQGVVVGDAVSAGGEALIGSVTEVYATTARVTLFSAPGQTFQALLTPGSGPAVPITVQGQGSGSMIATVPAGTTAVVGEPVVFPGVAGGLSATVFAVIASEGDSFETLYLHLPANPLALQLVEVIK